LSSPAAYGKELFTVQEVAEILSLSERTVESLISKGWLRSAIAPGTERSRRVSRNMIQEYIESFDSQNPPVLRSRKRKP
jgi:excisionase family DNA binding protein